MAPTRLPGMVYRGTLHTNALISRSNTYGENAMSLSACTTYFSRRSLVLDVYFLELKCREIRDQRRKTHSKVSVGRFCDSQHAHALLRRRDRQKKQLNKTSVRTRRI